MSDEACYAVNDHSISARRWGEQKGEMSRDERPQAGIMESPPRSLKKGENSCAEGDISLENRFSGGHSFQCGGPE